MSMVKSILTAVNYAVFPRRCLFCGKVIAPNIEACSLCEQGVARVEEPRCGLCGRGQADCLCEKHKPFYSGIVSPFYYEDSVRRCIHNFKFRGSKNNAAFLAEEMYRAIVREQETTCFELVVCVPLSRNSLQKRGYNQSALLGATLAEKLGVSFVPQALKKICETPSQHSVAASMRRGNLVGVFDVPEPSLVDGAIVLLCDDIATTGSTLNECAKMLLLAGAKEVWCVTAAVTRRNEPRRPLKGR